MIKNIFILALVLPLQAYAGNFSKYSCAIKEYVNGKIKLEHRVQFTQHLSIESVYNSLSTNIELSEIYGMAHVTLKDMHGKELPGSVSVVYGAPLRTSTSELSVICNPVIK